jgi:DNA-directed RNA polymerase subunit RPC12/RpoP
VGQDVYLDYSARLRLFFLNVVIVKILWRNTWQGTPPVLRCPKCTSHLVVRLGRKGLRDSMESMAGRFPFRCRRCRKEFYLLHRGRPDEDAL